MMDGCKGSMVGRGWREKSHEELRAERNGTADELGHTFPKVVCL